MKALITFTVLLISYFVYGFYISEYEIRVIPSRLKKEASTNYYDYRGVINVHSDLSIGSSPPMQIAAAAKAAGLDFMIMTDLNPFHDEGLNDSYSQGVLFLNGAKYSYLDSRLMYYSPDKTPMGKNLGEVQIRLADALTQKQDDHKDSLLVLADPYNLGNGWSGDLPHGLDGMEIINVKSLATQAWQRSKASVIWSFLVYPFNPSFSLARLYLEPSEEIALFDKTTQSQKLTAFAGAEASARAIPLSDYLVHFPSYVRNFEIASNHVLLNSELTGNFTGDRTKIFNALKNGQFYLALDALGDPRGFFTVLEDHGHTHMMGSRVKLGKGMSLQVHMPGPPQVFYEIIVYRNGDRYRTFNEADVSMPVTEPGVYRVQVRVAIPMPLPDANRWISWIYGNPFFVN